MSFSNLGTYACRALQASYLDYFGKNAAAYKTGGSIATLKYLLSPQNTKGFKQINVESIPGKERGVAFLYNNPFCFSVANPAEDCKVPRVALTNPSQEIVFDLTGNAMTPVDATGKPTSLKFKVADLKKYCTMEDSAYIEEQIFRYLDRFEKQVNEKIGQLLAVMVGTNLVGDAITRLPLFVQNSITNSSVLNPDSIWALDQNYRDVEGEGQYALLGGKVLSKMQTFAKWSNLSSSGIDLSNVDDMNPYSYYDKSLDATLGLNGFLQLSPGAAQLVTFNEFKGENNRAVTDLYSNGTIVMPSTGLEIDWRWRFDYNCQEWEFIPSLYVELAVNKAGGCGALSTTNGIIRYEDCSFSTVSPTCPQ
jgi:hypothetical protein